MKLLPWMALACSLFTWTCNVQRDHARADALVEEMRQQFCSDKRVCIWDVTFSSTNPLVLSGRTNLPAAKEELTGQLQQAGIPFIDSLLVLPSVDLEGHHFGLVNVSVCNIRSEPRHASELATQATLGTPLNVYERQGEWLRVQTPDQYIGWLDAGGLVTLDSLDFDRWRKSDRVVITAEVSFAQSGPGSTGMSVSDLVAGCILEKRGETGDFYQVSFPDKRVGYVSKKQARLFEEWTSSPLPGQSVVLQAAYSLLGRPYLWGGTSVKGMDCSGFTKTVFFENGLILPRDASQQVRIGEEISIDSLHPGDLLFFGRKAAEEIQEKITHVAIYLGEGQFIHSSGQVKIESLDPDAPNFSEYRSSTFVRAKRLHSLPLDSAMLVGYHPLYQARN